jgi:hypothetical protein
MSVRHTRTRPLTCVNGNREWLARSYCVEQRELTLLSARPNCRKHSHCRRLTISSGRLRGKFKGRTHFARAKKLPGSNEGNGKTITLDVNNTLRYGDVQND